MSLLTQPDAKEWKDAVFWQIAQGNFTDIPKLMGYSIYTEQYHYTEWVNIKRLVLQLKHLTDVMILILCTI